MNHRLLAGFFILISACAMAQQCVTSVMVNAFDSRTREPLRGLRASDFAASLRGSDLEVEFVAPVFHNRVLVLLDLSGYKDSASRLTVLRSTVEFISQAPPDMPVAFGAFAEHAVLTAGFSSDPEALSASLESTMVRASVLTGEPSLPHALRAAISAFGDHRPGDTILLVSSGDGRVSRNQWKNLAREFARREIRLQLLMKPPAATFSDSLSMFSSFAAADHIHPDLVKLANTTGGVLMGFMNSEWYDAAASGYILKVREPQAAHAKSWQLRVRNYGEEFDVDPILFYPRNLPACSAPLIASTKPQRKTTQAP